MILRMDAPNPVAKETIALTTVTALSFILVNKVSCANSSLLTLFKKMAKKSMSVLASSSALLMWKEGSVLNTHLITSAKNNNSLGPLG